jgi:hypothetical protein
MGDAKALALCLLGAMIIIALLVVPAGTISVSAKPNGGIREVTPAAVIAPQVQPAAPKEELG